MNKLLRNPDIVWRVEKRREAEIVKALEAGDDVADKGSVILIVSGMMHQLNLVGGKIWSLCDGQRSLADLVEALAFEFEVEREELAEDVEEFVDDLLQRGWLKHG
ncbi:pyrroloquinoline quinone biosynthesis peptide chaperone PqqD [Trichloromonas sp.]|uniref:pyrroloquinoline quinone biosynthesis peptide chaperone PqqD n=1 Tax=Trichloromonas sp. TaxID=3069249 RepID=UPI003D818151